MIVQSSHRHTNNQRTTAKNNVSKNLKSKRITKNLDNNHAYGNTTPKAQHNSPTKQSLCLPSYSE